MTAAAVIDSLIEAPVVTSFTSIGYRIRKAIGSWRDLDSYDLSGRVVAITGPTSGLGRAAAERFARLGARVILIARDPQKAEKTRADIVVGTGNHRITTVVADMGDPDRVRSAAAAVADDHGRLDVLVHIAGALHNERRLNAAGHEATVAVHVVGPFLLTGLLSSLLQATPGARVLTMASGGMYTAGLTVERLEMDEASYHGARQYARAKRAQVTLNEMWAESEAGSGIRFHALHPGWADTPGLAASLPGFRRLIGRLLRTPQQGIDTLVWLGADDDLPLQTNGGFWLDRRQRPIHKLASTRRTDTPQRRRRLWDWVSERAGWDLSRAVVPQGGLESSPVNGGLGT